MSSQTIIWALRSLLAICSLSVTGCVSMLGDERTAYVIVRKASQPYESPALAGITEKEIKTLLARHSYRYSKDPQAAWLIHIEERSSPSAPQAKQYVLAEITPNPKSRHPSGLPRDPTSIDREHPSLSMLKRYEDFEQSRPSDSR